MTPPPRLTSLDALRGGDMLWITGGRTLVAALAAATGWPALVQLEAQLHHASWHGFTAWDLVFPLFLFVSGATLPFSQDRRLEAGSSRASLGRKILRRALLLVLLGAIYNGLLTFDGAQPRWASVLGRIGLAWAGAATLCLWLRTRGRALAALGLLLAYGALLAFWPVADGAGTLVQGRNVVDLFDQRVLPGRLHRGDHDPEGLLATVPAVATALLGALAGGHLRRRGAAQLRTALELGAAGLISLGAGWLLDAAQPVNKALWTPAFALVAAGWSALLLALFHAAIDVPAQRASRPGAADGSEPPLSRWSRRLAFPLVVLGSNAILLYLADRFLAFDAVAALLLDREPLRLHPAFVPAGALLLRFALLYALWRKRLFLRV